MRDLNVMALLLAVWLLAPLAPTPASGALGAQDTTGATAKGAKQNGGKKKGGADAAPAPKSKEELRAKAVKDSINAVRQPLFAERAPLPFTLIANFGAISKNRDSTSKTRYAGTLLVRDAAGAERRIPVQLRTRGHFRLKRSTCKFVNLLVTFPGKGKETDGTPFDGQKSLKLGGHCQDDHRYEQLLRREYLAYRIFSTVTPRSFQARLATGTYVASASGKTIDTRTAMWIENEDEMAARQGGRLREFRRALFADMDFATLDQMAIFEYLIGNTDWSIYALHNVRLVVDDSSRVYPIPYDFDFSGLVNAPYAAPAPQLQIRNVRERLYRGPCRTWDEIAPSLARFTARQAEILALPAEIPGLDDREVRDAREFLGAFFETAANPGEAKDAFVERCLKKPGA